MGSINTTMIKSALEKEFRRNGQVFVVVPLVRWEKLDAYTSYIHTSHYIRTFRNIIYHIYVARYLFFSFVCMYVCNCMKYTLNIVVAITYIHTFIQLDMWNLRE